jgi:hypothetical protein
MFKLFKSNSERKADAKIQWAQDAAYNVIMTQLDLGGAFTDQAAQQRLLTPRGCGYIFGFADALLLRAGVIDDVAAMAALLATYVGIFAKEQGPKIFHRSLDIQTQADFVAGRKMGGNEAMQWLAAPDKSAPMGLADYLNGRP